jgi:3-methyladenine DNA glycosylase AlkD
MPTTKPAESRNLAAEADRAVVRDALAQIGKEIGALADPKRAEGVRIAVPGARTNGAPVPGLRDVARRATTPRGKVSFATACAILDALARRGDRESLLVGTFIVAKHQAALKTTPWSRIVPWLRAVDNWETCDQLSAAVIATMVDAQPALARHVLALTKSKDQWQRRLAVATAASLNQHGRSQPATTVAVCRALEKDPEPRIRRAVEWARRELARNSV